MSLTSILRAGFSVRAAIQRPASRFVHSSPTNFARKEATFEDAIFSPNAEDDLFGDMSAEQPVSEPPPLPLSTRKRVVYKLSLAKRQAFFNSLLEFVVPRLTATGIKKRQLVNHPPYMRSSSFSRLIQLAWTKPQLEQVVKLFPLWITSHGSHFHESVSEEFARRCATLECPELALSVYGNFPCYQFPLTKPAAHRLMHALYSHGQYAEVLTVAAYYPAHNLGSVDKDIVASTILTAATIQSGHKSVALALLRETRHALIPVDGENMGPLDNWLQDGSIGAHRVKKYLHLVNSMLLQKTDYPTPEWLPIWCQRFTRRQQT